MSARLRTVCRRRAARLALTVVGPALATVLLALGFGLLFDARAAGDLARIGLGPGSRMLLGVSHLAGGFALLAPSLAEPVSIFLGFVVSGMAMYLLALGQVVVAGGPALTAVVLLAYGVSSWLRHRAAEMSWQRMLLRYGEEADARALHGGRSRVISPTPHQRPR
ncbi:hypothetical protein V5E97_24360 [Singulisphaera sp. Ch08]|uniref:Uncharacterized protein n=1 Tax=Singulisphaera sp. Ch08 TaxID=3120278 RepID=A0AAU7C7V9_9BACT